MVSLPDPETARQLVALEWGDPKSTARGCGGTVEISYTYIYRNIISLYKYIYIYRNLSLYIYIYVRRQPKSCDVYLCMGFSSAKSVLI